MWSPVAGALRKGVGNRGVLRESSRKQFNRELPCLAWLALVVHPAVRPGDAFDKSARDQSRECFLDGALRGEAELFDQVRRIHPAVWTLGDRGHDGEAVSLSEQRERDLLDPLGLRVRHADMLLRKWRYAVRVTRIL